ncbi:MAG: AAA family ATPase [Chloroflexi bacterium]|nr:AAA family ATPase [Chloroflexota bacterium]
MSEPELIQQEREIVRRFRVATLQRAKAEAEAEARQKAEKEAHDAALKKSKQEAEAYRTKALADSENRLKTERAAADNVLQQAEQKANERLNKDRSMFNDAHNFMVKGGWQKQIEGITIFPLAPEASGDPIAEMDRCVSLAETSFGSLRNALVSGSSDQVEPPHTWIEFVAFWIVLSGLGLLVALVILSSYSIPAGLRIGAALISAVMIAGLVAFKIVASHNGSRINLYKSLAQLTSETEYWHKRFLDPVRERHSVQVSAAGIAYKQTADQIEPEYQNRIRQITHEHQQRIADCDTHYRQAMSNARTEYETTTMDIKRDAEVLVRSAEALSPPWDESLWKSWETTTEGSIPQFTRIGRLEEVGSWDSLNLPALYTFIGGRSLLFKAAGAGKGAGVQPVQALLLRLLATLPPGKLRFTFVDPVGLGQNVAAMMHLADYDEALITGKAWTEPQHIEQRLADLTEHMENVIQKYLRNQFATIEDYNSQAGEIAEPYRVLVVFDFPANFSEAAARRLVSIVQNGPRCGVYAVILVDTDKPPPNGFNIAELERDVTVIAWDGSRFVWQDKDFQESPLLVSGLASAEVTIEQPYFLITDYKVTRHEEIVPLMERLVEQAKTRRLVVIANGIEGDALKAIEGAKSLGTFDTIAVKVPGLDKHGSEILRDIAAVTGAVLISAGIGTRVETTGLPNLGRADKVMATMNRIVIHNGKGDPKDRNKRIDSIKARLREPVSDYERNRMEQRIAALTSESSVFEIRKGDCLLELDAPPSAELFDRIISQVGEAAKEASKVEVPFERIAPPQELWWKGDSRTGLRAPLGPAGARKIQYLDLGKGTAQHALVVGKTGSGKSTLLHTLITDLALGYSPTEVELYLVDFKKGVEFKTYATHQLPHARVIAIESEREFGLSVLQGLDAELKRRGDLFRAAGVDHIADYRAKNGQAAPRILLVVDEFQEFFTEDDAIASQSSQVLDRLVRQGRAFGIHVLLGSQTLAGAYTLARSTIDQMAVRIALQCSEADSRLILADDNPAARLLSRPGEAIYNAVNGLVEGNNRFQVAWLPDDKRDQYLERVQELAQKQKYRPPRPQIIFEGNAPAEVEKNRTLGDLIASPTFTAPSRVTRAWIGEPIAIRDSVAANFRRQSGSNLLIVGQNDEAAMGMMAVALISLASQLVPSPASGEGQGGGSPFYILDFGAADASYADYFTRFAEHLPRPPKIGRRRELPEFINELAAEVQRRMDASETNAPKYLFLYGLQRARDLRQEEGMGFSLGSEEPAAPNLTQQFATILREGPDVGIHTLVWCDTVTNLNRALDRRTLREFAMRAVFQMSAEDSSSLIDTPAASKLGAYRALFYSEEEGRLEKFQPYALPSEQWLKWVGEQLRRKKGIAEEQKPTRKRSR